MARVPALPLRADILLCATLFEELEDGISEEFLQQHTGLQDLGEVKSLELTVDAVGAGQRVECLGELLPNLQQLRLSQSHICTVRDLGINLTTLRVLWLSRCSLQDLGGISALSALEELYVSFNDVKDLSPLVCHEVLQVLDLEGNLVEDFEEVRSLEALVTLRELNLSLNPFWKREAITRKQVLEALPQIETLDDLPRSLVEVVDEETLLESSLLDVDVFSMKLAEADPCKNAEWDEEFNEDSESEAEDITSPAQRGPALQPLCIEGSGPEVECSEAVALLRAERARITEEVAARRSAGPSSPKASILAPEEPTEQDLVVEALKRAARPAPSLWSFRGSTGRSAEVHRRPNTGFFPQRRDCGGWSAASSSTAYRPTTASSSASSGRSAMFSYGQDLEPGSDLTAGDDGSALVGNPLAAIRRRRRTAASRGEGGLEIRDLLRRFEASAGQVEEPSPQPEGPVPRPTTSDVRIRRGGAVVADTGDAAGSQRCMTAPAKRPSTRGGLSQGSGGLGALGRTLPSFATRAGEVLLCE